MSFSLITTEYFEPLEAAHAHIDDNRYDTAECGAAGQLKLDLSEQLWHIIAFMYVVYDVVSHLTFFRVIFHVVSVYRKYIDL